MRLGAKNTVCISPQEVKSLASLHSEFPRKISGQSLRIQASVPENLWGPLGGTLFLPLASKEGVKDHGKAYISDKGSSAD